MAIKLTLSLALVVMGTAITLPQPASALPAQQVCRITTYYKEAALLTVVGTRTTCPVKLTGHTSRYSEVEVIVVDNGGGHTAGGQGMPCEFVPDKPGDWSPKDTCQNLPLPRGTVFN